MDRITSGFGISSTDRTPSSCASASASASASDIDIDIDIDGSIG